METKLQKVLNYWPMFLFGLFFFGLGFGACANSGTSGQNEIIVNGKAFAGCIHVFEYDGHEYLIYEDIGKTLSGASFVSGITHSGSCKKCKQNGSN